MHEGWEGGTYVICGGQDNFVQLVFYFLLYMDTEDQTQVAGLEQQVSLPAEPSCLFKFKTGSHVVHTSLKITMKLRMA